MSFGITELIIIMVIVLLLFGTTKLKSLGTDLGAAIKGFRAAVTEDKEGAGAGQATSQKKEAAKSPNTSSAKPSSKPDSSKSA